MDEIRTPLTAEELAAVRERLAANAAAGRGPCEPDCASIRYPGSHDQPPDPCTCGGEIIARLLDTYDELRVTARAILPEVMDAEIGGVSYVSIAESMARLRAKGDRWDAFRAAIA